MTEDNTQIHWMCCKKNVESRRYLNDLLPRNYHYKITSYSVIEESNVICETKFECTFLVNVCDKETLMTFFNIFKDLSKTDHNIEKGDSKPGKNVLVSGSRKCCHKIRPRINPETNDTFKLQRPGVHTECPALIKFRINKTIDHDHSNDCTPKWRLENWAGNACGNENSLSQQR